jgi:23S rRNA U2552 (ribose-2'-O)-methylase RlmE/FtsJ
MFSPFIHKIDKGTSDILLDGENNIITSSTISLPLISLGYHSFLHRTKEAMNITKKIDMKNEFYYIVNPFELNVPNYNDSLINLTKVYFGVKDDKNINSLDFYKIWEILLLFNIANVNKQSSELSFACLSNNPEILTQSVINFREKLLNGTSKDTILSVSIDTNILQSNNYNNMNKQFLEYKDESKKSKQKGGKKNNINNIVDNVSNLKKEINKSKKYVDLVIANGDLVWNDIKYQEQEAYQLILGEIIGCLRVQNKNGCFVLRLFESFTFITIKLIYLLTSFYEESYIYKPYYSRNSDSERYLICKNFIYNPDDKTQSIKLDKMITSLEDLMAKINTNEYLYDIYPDLIIPQEFLNKIKFINIKIANLQQIMINDIVVYIKENNYFGEKYHQMRETQISNTKWWVSQFYPPSNNLYEKSKEEIKKIIDITLQKNDMEYNKFISVLV